MFKMSTVFILHFAPSLRFSLSLQSAFYTQSAVYPWSAVCSLRYILITKRIKLTEFKFHTNLALSLPRFEQPGHGPSG